MPKPPLPPERCGEWWYDEQRRDLRVGDQHDVAAVTAVAAVGTGERLELLALDRHAAVAALARAQVQRHLVDECDHACLPPLRVER